MKMNRILTLSLLISLLILPSCRSIPVPTAELPDGWPDDIPIMEGFVLREAVMETDPDTGQTAMVVQAVGYVSNELVEAYYKNLPGWEFAPEIDMGRLGARISDTVVIVGFQGDRSFNASIVTIDADTMLSLTYIP